MIGWQVERSRESYMRVIKTVNKGDTERDEYEVFRQTMSRFNKRKFTVKFFDVVILASAYRS
jgi:hypothetical protein